MDFVIGSPVSSCCVDPSGRLLVSGHEDASCVLYDIRGQRFLQSFSVHSSDVRSVRLSPSSFYLLSASYDRTMVLTDLQGNLTNPLPSVEVASHMDKVITGRWHPHHCSFLTTSADKTSSVWTIPDIELGTSINTPSLLPVLIRHPVSGQYQIYNLAPPSLLLPYYQC